MGQIIRQNNSWSVNMQNRKEQRRAVIVIALLAFGTAFLQHSVYEFLGENKIVGFFAPINESVWEHLKLAFYPMVVFILCPVTAWQKSAMPVQRVKNAAVASVWSVCTVLFGYYGLHVGLSLNGKILDLVLDIGLLLAGDVLGCYQVIYRCQVITQKPAAVLAVAWIIIMTGIFWWFTVYPGTAEVFRIPQQ